MASINGITIKSLKKFKGHEGEPLAQGNIYYKGKKLGFWSQDSWGGSDSYDFDTSVLDAEVKKYKESDRVDPKHREYVDLDGLLYDLLNVTDSEKGYKKAIKGGWKTYVEATDGFHVRGYYSPESDRARIENSSFHKKFIKDSEKAFFKDAKIQISIYSEPADFDIAV